MDAGEVSVTDSTFFVRSRQFNFVLRTVVISCHKNLIIAFYTDETIYKCIILTAPAS